MGGPGAATSTRRHRADDALAIYSHNKSIALLASAQFVRTAVIANSRTVYWFCNLTHSRRVRKSHLGALLFSLHTLCGR